LDTPDPNAPIADDEVLWRRVSKDKMCLPNQDGVLPTAFDPSKYDDTGISVFRGRWHTPRQIGCVLRTKGKTPSWVVGMTARQYRELGLHPIPDPQPGMDGHALIPEINLANGFSDENEIRKQELAKLASARIGPRFKGPEQTDSEWDVD